MAACVNITLSTQNLKLAAEGENEGRSSSPSLPLFFFFFNYSFPALPLSYVFPWGGGRGVCETELGAINGDAPLQRGDSLTSEG